METGVDFAAKLISPPASPNPEPPAPARIAGSPPPASALPRSASGRHAAAAHAINTPVKKYRDLLQVVYSPPSASSVARAVGSPSPPPRLLGVPCPAPAGVSM